MKQLLNRKFVYISEQEEDQIMFNKLTCNYRKCRKVLDHFAVACSCSHIFCEEHCPSNFGGTNVKCLACKVSLSQEKMDIIPVDLAPNERFKSMVLAGQRPEIIMDICSRALAFWMYQSQQEIDYNLYISKRLSDKCKAVEEDSKNLVAMLQREKTNLEIELQRVSSIFRLCCFFIKFEKTNFKFV